MKYSGTDDLKILYCSMCAQKIWWGGGVAIAVGDWEKGRDERKMLIRNVRFGVKMLRRLWSEVKNG